MTRFRAFVDVASDPALIPGIHEACDQWCAYCPATRHCLAYRCSVAAISNSRIGGFTGRIGEVLGFLIHRWRGVPPRTSHVGRGFTPRHPSTSARGALSEVEGQAGRKGPPYELVASGTERPMRGCEASPIVDIDDPIDRMSRRYGRTVEAYLSSRPDFPPNMKPHPSGPTPVEVLAWFRELLPAKIYRALASAALAAGGSRSREQDAIGSAKVALIGIDRSLDAIARLAADAPDQRLELLQAQLLWLRRELEARFPGARSFVRIGLDGGTSPVTQRPDRTGGGSI
jgi:hypothetical protein